jgi:hypothetical protein
MAPDSFPTHPVRRVGFATLALVGLAWLALSMVSPSASIPQVWPWSGLAAVGWGAVAVAGMYGWGRGARLGATVEWGLWLLAGAAIASAASSDAPGVSAPAAWGAVALCLAPFAWRWLASELGRERVLHGLALAAGIVLLASVLAWWPQVSARAADGAGWREALNLRNDQPFGHSTYTAAFAVMALGIIAAAAVTASGGGRGLAVLGGLAALAAVVGSGSRAGILAAAVGGGVAALVALPLVRSLAPWQRAALLVLALALLGLGIAANPRLRTRVMEGRWTAEARESNAQRSAMAHGALLLGAERPFLGWGPGMVPHVFPSVRARVGGTVDNVLQVHHSPLQAWATLGAAGIVATLLLLVGSAARALRALRSERPRLETASLAGGLAAGATFGLFDHSIDVPAIGLLATALLALLGDAPPPPRRPALRIAPPALLGAGLLLFLLPGVARDQTAHRHHAAAVEAAAAGDAPRFLAEIQAAAAAVPDAPYLRHLEAGYLATGQPIPAAPSRAGAGVAPPEGGPARAAQLLRDSLAVNPFLEYAEYNLGWLRLADDAAMAERHFAAAARLAPHRVGVYLGLGLARAAQGDAAGAITAFAVERINAPVEAFSPLFREPTFAALEPEVAARARALLGPSHAGETLDAATAEAVREVWTSLAPSDVTFGAPYLRVRPGYGLLMGFPEGRPPADVAPLYPVVLPESARARLPSPGWVSGRALLGWAGVATEASP